MNTETELIDVSGALRNSRSLLGCVPRLSGWELLSQPINRSANEEILGFHNLFGNKVLEFRYEGETFHSIRKGCTSRKASVRKMKNAIYECRSPDISGPSGINKNLQVDKNRMAMGLGSGSLDLLGCWVPPLKIEWQLQDRM